MTAPDYLDPEPLLEELVILTDAQKAVAAVDADLRESGATTGRWSIETAEVSATFTELTAQQAQGIFLMHDIELRHVVPLHSATLVVGQAVRYGVLVEVTLRCRGLA